MDRRTATKVLAATAIFLAAKETEAEEAHKDCPYVVTGVEGDEIVSTVTMMGKHSANSEAKAASEMLVKGLTTYMDDENMAADLRGEAYFKLELQREDGSRVDSGGLIGGMRASIDMKPGLKFATAKTMRNGRMSSIIQRGVDLAVAQVAYAGMTDSDIADTDLLSPKKKQEAKDRVRGEIRTYRIRVPVFRP